MMEKERLEGLIIDYIDDRLNAVDRQLIEQELMKNDDARKLYQELKEVMSAMDQSEPLNPSAALMENFRNNLKKEIELSGNSKTVFFNPALYRIAAAVTLLILGAGIGVWISRNNAEQDRLAAIQREMEITRKELADTKQLMLGMLDNDQSASQRIKGVNVALGLTKADPEIVDALLKTMYSDRNTNVRLAALDALARLHDDPEVRRKLIESLSKQTDPMVQIKLIQLMVDIQEKGVVDDLRKIVNDASVMKAVKDEAYTGILKLS
jgi:hypothetical protein